MIKNLVYRSLETAIALTLITLTFYVTDKALAHRGE